MWSLCISWLGSNTTKNYSLFWCQPNTNHGLFAAHKPGSGATVWSWFANHSCINCGLLFLNSQTIDKSTKSYCSKLMHHRLKCTYEASPEQMGTQKQTSCSKPLFAQTIVEVQPLINAVFEPSTWLTAAQEPTKWHCASGEKGKKESHGNSTQIIEIRLLHRNIP